MTLRLKKILFMVLCISFYVAEMNSLEVLERLSEYFKDDLNSLKSLIFRRSTVDALHSQSSGEDCKPTVNLDRCNTNESNSKEWQWSRFKEYYILAITTKGCINTTLSYNWRLTKKDGEFVKTFPEFENKASFVLRYFTLESGLYYLYIKVVENYNDNEAIAKCLITITDEDSEAKIFNDEMELIKTNSDILVQESILINKIIASQEKRILVSKRKNIFVPLKLSIDKTEYTFQPQDTPFGYRQFRNDTTTTVSVSVPVPASVSVPVSVSVSVPVSVSVSDPVSVSVSVPVSVSVSVPNPTLESTPDPTPEPDLGPQNASVSLECMKNCDDIVNRATTVYIHSWCTSGCDDPHDIEWQIIPHKPTRPVHNRIFIHYWGLTQGSNYTVIARYITKIDKSSANLTFTVSKSPYWGHCKVENDVVETFVTKIKCHCPGFHHNKKITIRTYYKAYDNRDYLIAWGPKRRFDFFLPGQKPGETKNGKKSILLTIKGIDPDGLFSTSTIYVDCKFHIRKFNIIEEIVNDNGTEYNFFEKSIKAGKVQEVVQYVHTLSQEMRREQNKSLHLECQFIIFAALNKTDLISSDVILGVAGALKMIYLEYNITFAAEVMNFVKRLAEKQLEFIKTCPRPLHQEVRSSQIAHIISDITSKFSNKIRGEIHVDNLVFNIFQYFPKLDKAVISEEYPNYNDVGFENNINGTDLLISIMNDMDAANQYVSLAYALTLATQELHKEYTCTGGNRFKYAADFAYNLKLSEFGFQDIFVAGYHAIAHLGKDRLYTVLIVYAMTPYHWLDKDSSQSKNSISQSYYSKDKDLKDFSPRYTAKYFHIENGGAAFYKASVTMPQDSLWSDDKIDQEMTVHRIHLKKSAGLLIVFSNLHENKLRVHIKYNSRPSYKDVKDYQIVSKSNNTIPVTVPTEQEQYGDAWLYVAVLPEFSESLRGFRETVPYDIGFVSTECSYLNKETHTWVQNTCKVGKDISMKHMPCLCTNNVGHFGYQLSPVYYKLDPYFIVPLVYLAVSVNFMIMFLVFAVFACYCIALCFAIGTTRRTVYFACDNIISELYGYLIIIKTGDKVNAGTTSNIGIKLFGKDHRCRSHMLNYPDPDKRLLQMGSQDWFVITTQHHLGDLDHIYVWHDSVGLEPSWYCDWIRIKDLQLRHEWFFNVQKWFCVIRGESNYASLQPTEEKQKSTSESHYWVKRYCDYFRYYHTWNILKKYQGYDLTYVERITLVLSAIYTTMLFVIIIYGFPELTIYDNFVKDDVQFNAQILKIGVLAAILSFMFHLLFTILFRTKNYNIFRVVSFDFVWLGWALITVHVVVCMIFLVHYGIWMAYVTGIAVLLCTIVALLISIILLEGIYILFKLKRSKIPKVSIDPATVINEIENQRAGLYSRFGNNLLVPYLGQKYRPQTREEWLQKRQKEIRREEIARQLYDFLMFLLFAILLYIIVFANKRELDPYSNIKMKQMVSGYYTKAKRFDDVTSFSDLKGYINETLALATQPAKWYSDFNVVDPGMMIDYNTKLLGVTKLRQFRVCKDCCSLVKPVRRSMNWTCNPEYEPKYSIIGEYQEFWENRTKDNLRKLSSILSGTYRQAVDENNPKFKLARLKSIWAYEDEPIGTTGYINHYPGGGYSAPLGRHLYNTYYNMKYLVDYQWLDNTSRVVFVEFFTYNVNYNIFNDVKLFVEQSASGLWVKTYQIHTFRLLFVSNEFQTMIYIVIIAFLVLLTFLIFNYITGMTEDNFWKNRWNYVDLLIIIVSIICIIIYRQKSNAIKKFLDKLSYARHNEVVYYDNLRHIDVMLITFLGLLIALISIRMWKLLRFGKRFRVIEATFSCATKPLIAVFTCHWIIILLYAAFGYLVFGSDFKEYRNFTISIGTILLLTINLQKMYHIVLVYNYHNSFGYFYYISYILCSFVLIVLYIAVIAISYHKMAHKYSNNKIYYTTKQYIKDKSRYEMEKLRRKLRRVRMKGGMEEENLEKKVRAKKIEHRYSNLVMITSYKLYCMRFIAKSVIINKYKPPTKKLSNSRKRLIDKVVFLILSRNRAMLRKEMVYVGIDANGNVQMVREEQIVEMEFIADYIVNCGTRKNLIKVFFDEIVVVREKKNEEKEEEDEPTIEESVQEFTDRLIFILDQLKSILKIMSHIRVIELE